MAGLDKKSLSERDICTKFITPALTAGNKWDLMSQIPEQVYFTKGRAIVRGQFSTRGEQIKASGYNLDIKNPNVVDPGHADADKLLAEYQQLVAAVNETRAKLKRELQTAFTGSFTEPKTRP